ncbi:DJ-1 family glyoxalase III [Verrucomicrobiota bacterium]
MARVLLPLADGAEEMEAVIIIDVLRRARWEVVSASVKDASGRDSDPERLHVACSRGVRLIADSCWGELDIDSFDLLILPGGSEGTDALCADNRVLRAARFFAESQRLVAAVCAAPLVLQAAGVLRGRKATCHPAVRDRMADPEISDDRVVVDGNIVTSQGPGTAMEFALAVIRLVEGPAAAETVASGLVL